MSAQDGPRVVAPGASWMPIGELSRRIGISTDLLRKWECRYGVLRPDHTSSNRRLYSRLDEARVRLMLSHVRAGVPAAQAAQLATAARFRVRSGASAGVAVPAPAPAPGADAAALAMPAALASLARFDEGGADQATEKVLAMSTASAAARDVLLPMFAELTAMRSDGRISEAQRRFASTFIENRLLGLARGWDRGLGPRGLVAATPGEAATMVSFGVALHGLGWRITYMSDPAPAEVAEAAAVIHPRLIILGPTVPLASASGTGHRATVAVLGASGPADRGDALLHLPEDPVAAAEAVIGWSGDGGSALSQSCPT